MNISTSLCVIFTNPFSSEQLIVCAYAHGTLEQRQHAIRIIVRPLAICLAANLPSNMSCLLFVIFDLDTLDYCMTLVCIPGSFVCIIRVVEQKVFRKVIFFVHSLGRRPHEMRSMGITTLHRSATWLQCVQSHSVQFFVFARTSRRNLIIPAISIFEF
jgi:hypothetical protein